MSSEKTRIEALRGETAELMQKHTMEPSDTNRDNLEKSIADLNQELEKHGADITVRGNAMSSLDKAKQFLGGTDVQTELEKAADKTGDWASKVANGLFDVAKSSAFDGRGTSEKWTEKSPLTNSRPASGNSTAPDHLDLGGLWTPQSLGVRNMVGTRRYAFTDIVTHVPVDSASVEWMEMVDDMVGGEADFVAEGGLKPERGGYQYVKRTGLVKTLAIAQPFTRQALRYVPRLEQIVRNGLAKKIRSKINTQIASGDGLSDNFTGLMHATTALPTQPIGTDSLAIAILKAILSIELGANANEDEDLFTVNAVAMHPLTYLSDSFATARDTTGRFIFIDPRDGINFSRAWGLPVILTKKVPQGQALVGDFTQAEVWDEGVIEYFMTDSHSDEFMRNILRILAEVHLGFGIIAKSAFRIVKV